MGWTVEWVTVALGPWHGVTAGTSQEETQTEGITLGNGVGGHVHICPLLPEDGLPT